MVGTYCFLAVGFCLTYSNWRVICCCAFHLFSFLMRFTKAQFNCLIVGLIFTSFYLFRPYIAFSVAAFIFLVSALTSVAASYVFNIWMQIGKLLGKVNAIIILSIIFFLILVPLSFVRRWLTKQDKRSLLNTSFHTRNHLYTKEDLLKPW